MPVPAITVADLKALRDQRKEHVLLDVREPEEFEIAKIEGSVLIPLNQLPSRLGELPKDKSIVVHCHHGGRSAQATAFLNQNGFSAQNLSGGIDAWSDRIDPAVPRY